MARARLLNSFDDYTEGKGCISKDDLVELLVELGQPLADAKQTVECAHLDKNGHVDCNEFISWCIGPPPPVPVLPTLPVSIATAQNAYRDGISGMSKAAASGNGHADELVRFVESHYAFASGAVMFKPRPGQESANFASTPAEVAKYFDNPLLQYIVDILIENDGIVTKGALMFAHGRVMSTFVNNLVNTIDFTFGYEADEHGGLRLFLHHSCDPQQDPNGKAEQSGAEAEQQSLEEIAAAQQAWTLGLMEIANSLRSSGDGSAEAERFVESLYSFQSGPVLFKTSAPAMGAVYFHKSRDDVVSYFSNPVLQALTGVRFENLCSITRGECIFVRGVYHFSTALGTDAQGEYLFGYERNASGSLSIFLQHSSTPFL